MNTGRSLLSATQQLFFFLKIAEIENHFLAKKESVFCFCECATIYRAATHFEWAWKQLGRSLRLESNGLSTKLGFEENATSTKGRTTFGANRHGNKKDETWQLIFDKNIGKIKVRAKINNRGKKQQAPNAWNKANPFSSARRKVKRKYLKLNTSAYSEKRHCLLTNDVKNSASADRNSTLRSATHYNTL